MDKQVFLASSGEAREVVEHIAGILEEVPAVRPRLWYREFHSGDITFVRIQELSRELAGALVLATPDDSSIVRGDDVKVPRSNVVFEYGFLSASLGLSRVALCRYDSVQLPSDVAGVTYIPMGGWPCREISTQTTLRIKDWARNLPPSALGGLAADIQHYENRLKELRQSYRDVLDGKVEQSRRAISFQLEVMEERSRESENAGRASEIWILGLNATGPLHQGRELLIRTLARGGKLRLLLLDPMGPAFQQRCLHELDGVGRIGAELLASFHILADVVAQAKPEAGAAEVRLHNQPPDRSLMMIDCESEDGIVMENPYPELKGKRGLEGQMYPLVQRGRTARGYRDNVAYFKTLWESARRVTVDGSHVHRIEEWPFSVH